MEKFTSIALVEDRCKNVVKRPSKDLKNNEDSPKYRIADHCNGCFCLFFFWVSSAGYNDHIQYTVLLI